MWGFAVSSISNYMRKICQISCQKIKHWTLLPASCSVLSDCQRQEFIPVCCCVFPHWFAPFFSYKCKNENTLYSYACMVYYSRLCSIPGTLLCHKQYDRPRHRKLNLSSFFFLPLFFRLHLLVIFFLSVCLWESTSLYSQTFTLLGTLSGVWTEL